MNRVQVKAATQAQAARERDLDTLPIEVLYAVEEQMPERWRLGVLLGGVLRLRSGEARALQRRDFSLNGEVPTLRSPPTEAGPIEAQSAVRHPDDAGCQLRMLGSAQS